MRDRAMGTLSVRRFHRVIFLLVGTAIVLCESFAPRSQSSAMNSGPSFLTRRSTQQDIEGAELTKTVIVAGATGYIGQAVVAESVRRGYDTVALVRDSSKLESEQGQRMFGDSFRGARVVECNVTDMQQLSKTFESVSEQHPVDAVISCLASPSGTRSDAHAIDYQATMNCLQAGQEVDAKSFVLLSAFCCRNPLLHLQQAKLRFEAELQQQSAIDYSIVRPTAFFKSVSGQLEAIKEGAPYVLFGDGQVTRCNPIAESELAEYMMDCLTDDSKRNRILNVGGPDEPLTNKMLGEMMFRAIGREPRFVYAPTHLFDPIIQMMQGLATMFKSEQLEDAAETARIGKYYAVEDMLTTAPSEKYGKITMQDHYDQIAARGQDPFTPVRATAIIGRALEALPAVALLAFVSVPAAYAITHRSVLDPNVDVTMLLSILKSSKY